jgi:hypothetical protein
MCLFQISSGFLRLTISLSSQAVGAEGSRLSVRRRRGTFPYSVSVFPLIAAVLWERWVSGAGGLHARALSEPYVNLSIHTAPALQPAIPKVAQWAKSAV